MKNKLAAAIVFLVMTILTAIPQQSNAANFREQGVHHQEGIACKECHTIEKPKDPPPSYKPCLACHGPYEKIAQRTKKLPGNPHDSHLGPMDCLKCHGVHEPMEPEKIPCMECHSDFEYKVK